MKLLNFDTTVAPMSLRAVFVALNAAHMSFPGDTICKGRPF